MNTLENAKLYLQQTIDETPSRETHKAVETDMFAIRTLIAETASESEHVKMLCQGIVSKLTELDEVMSQHTFIDTTAIEFKLGTIPYLYYDTKGMPYEVAKLFANVNQATKSFRLIKVKSNNGYIISLRVLFKIKNHNKDTKHPLAQITIKEPNA